MGESGRVFRRLKPSLLACVGAATLVAGAGHAGPESRLQLAQAGLMSSQPRAPQPAHPSAPPAGAGGFANRPAPAPSAPPAAVAPTPPASIVQPQGAAPVPAATAAAATPSAPALPFSLTQTAVGYSAANLRFGIGPTSYVVPRAEIRGTNLSRDDLASLLDPSSAVPLRERVSRLSASEITIPELRAETVTTLGRQLAVYRDIRLSDIASGQLASASATNGTFEAAAPDGPTRGTFARMDISDVDIGHLVSLLGAQDAASPTELRKVYGAFSIDGLTTERPKGARSRIARMSGRGFRARPTKEGWIATATAFSGHTDLNKASPEERGRVVTALVDLFEAFEIGSLEATGIEFSEPGGKDAAGRISRVAYTGGTGGSEFRIEGLEAGGDDGRVRVANFSIGGISLSPMLAAARELSGKAELTPADMRRLVPIVGSIRLAGIELKAKGDPEKREAPVQLSVGTLEFLADKPVESIPTDLRLNLRNLSVPIAATAKDESTRRLAGLGYDKVDASLTANLAWNEAGQELVIREFSTEATGMGSLLLRGVIGNVSRDAFSPDEALAAITWMGATARSLDIVIQNNGLFERLLARQAADKKRSVDDLRREYGMTAAVGIPVMLGNSAAAKALGQAVARFVAKPGRLTVEARTRDPGGLGVADVAAAPDPTALLDRIEITATAE